MNRAQINCLIDVYRQRVEGQIGKFGVQRGFYLAEIDGSCVRKTEKSCRVLINGRFALSVLSLAFGQTQPKVHSPSQSHFLLPN